MQEISSYTIGHKPTHPHLQIREIKMSANKIPKDGKVADHDVGGKYEIRTSSAQRSQFVFRENGNLFIVKFVPVVIFVIDRPLPRPSNFAGPWMKGALLDESNVVTGICRGTFMGDDRCSFIVRDPDDNGGKTRRWFTYRPTRTARLGWPLYQP